MRKTTVLFLSFIILILATLPAMGAVFTDTNGHWGEQDILKMGAKGLIFGDKNGCFYPEELVSRREAIALLVRLVDKEDMARQLQQGDNELPAGTKGVGDWAKGYLLCGKSNGIITDSELQELNWAAAASREELMIWISKALKLLPVVVDNDKVLQRFVDGSQINMLKAPYIVPLIQDNIIMGTNGYFYPSQPVKRAELATLMKRVDEKYLGQKIIRSQEGQVLSIATKPYKSVTVKNKSGQFTTLAATDYMAIYKNGQKTSLSNLAIGEWLEYITDNGQGLIYAETIAGISQTGPISGQYNYYYPDSSYYDNRGPAYGVIEGEVIAIDGQNNKLDLIVNGSWHRYNLGNNLLKRGNTYYYGNKELAIGDTVEITLNNDWIIALKISSGQSRSDSDSNDIMIYKATLDNVDSRDDEIELKRGTVDYWSGTSWKSKSGSLSLELDNNVDIYDYDGDELDIDELEEDYEGDSIYLLYDEDEEEVISIRVKKGTESVYKDEIANIERKYFELEDKNRDIYYDDSTMVVADGELLDIDDIEEEDEIRVVVNRSGSKYYAVLLEIEESRYNRSSSDDNEVTVYKATLDDVDSRDEEIELIRSSMRYWDGDEWEKKSRSLNLDIDSGVDIYDYDGDDLDLDELEEDDTIYLLYDEEEEEVLQVMVGKSERRMSVDRIDKVKSSYFELDGEKIYYDDWTIVLEGDELLDIDDIEEGDEVRVVINRSGSKYYAVLIEMEEYGDDDDDDDWYGEDCLVYRAELYSVDEDDEEIELDDDSIERLEDDGDWVNVHWNKCLDIGDANLYYNSDEIDLEDLEYYEGDDVYFACDEDAETVIKLSVCQDYDVFPEREIDEINTSKHWLELENEDDRIYFGDYTIFIEDGELLDEDYLAEGDEVHIIVDEEGYALLIQILD